jgi:hypothetical protein
MITQGEMVTQEGIVAHEGVLVFRVFKFLHAELSTFFGPLEWLGRISSIIGPDRGV